MEEKVMDQNNLMTQLHDKILNLISVQMKWEETAGKWETDKGITQFVYRSHTHAHAHCTAVLMAPLWAEWYPDVPTRPGASWDICRGGDMRWGRFWFDQDSTRNQDGRVKSSREPSSIVRLILSDEQISFWISLWTIFPADFLIFFHPIFCYCLLFFREKQFST